MPYLFRVLLPAVTGARTPGHARSMAGGDILSVGQIYPYDNPLLKEPLRLEHVKPRPLGHWGTGGRRRG